MPTVKYSEPYRTAVQLQRVMVSKANGEATKPMELASLARVWCELEETKRKLRMKPLPKPVDVSGQQGKRRGSQPRTSEGSEV